MVGKAADSDGKAMVAGNNKNGVLWPRRMKHEAKSAVW
jgi:hypothetical protein